MKKLHLKVVLYIEVWMWKCSICFSSQ